MPVTPTCGPVITRGTSAHGIHAVRTVVTAPSSPGPSTATDTPCPTAYS